MGTSNRGKRRFTCWGSYRGYSSVMASSPANANRKADGWSDLIIQGTAGAIGAVRREYIKGYFRERVRRGAVCTIEAGSSCRVKKIVIKDATYQGRKVTSEDSYYVFTKNGITFWVCDPYFVSIDGKRISNYI